MRRSWICLLFLGLLADAAVAAKPKVITFGKWLPVKWIVGGSEETALPFKVRALMVNNDVKEFTIGDPHDITDRLFVVRRALRLNDALPDDSKTIQKWRWVPGGWLMVDRSSAHISKLNLPDFDSFYSTASWYRDYVAYCGVSDDGEKLYAVVTQLGRKKPVVRKLIGEAKDIDLPDSQCASPVWQKQPVRVTFEPRGGEKSVFTIHGHAAELEVDNGQEAGEPPQ